MKIKSLVLTLFCLALGSQQMSAIDIEVGNDLTGYTITYDIYTFANSTSAAPYASMKKVTPRWGGMGEYTTLNLYYLWYYLDYYPIKSVGAEACKGLTGLKSVNLSLSDITEIGANAFNGCTNLETLSLPNTLIELRYGAFENCSKLESVTLPSTLMLMYNRAFAGCSSLSTVRSSRTSPANLYDYPNVFEGISEDCVLYIPFGTKSTYEAKGWTEDVFGGGIIEETTFLVNGVRYSQTGETTVSVGNGRESAMIYNETGVLTIPESIRVNGNTYSVTSVASHAFLNCSQLTSITLPSTINDIAENAFEECNGLTALNVGMTALPSTSEGGWDNAFVGIDKTKCKLYVPKGTSSVYSAWRSYFATIVDGETFTETVNGVETTFVIIGDNAVQLGDGTVVVPTTFSGAYTIPETVTHDGTTYTITAIGASAFSGCTNLTEAVIPNTVTTLGTNIFENCTNLTSVTLSQSVNKIPDSMFLGCTALASVDNTGSLQSIGVGAFQNCTALKEIYLPEGLTEIGESAFRYSGLQKLTLPSTVTRIEPDAFANMASLMAVYANMLVPPRLARNGDGVKQFHDLPGDCKLYVPQGTAKIYVQQALWLPATFTGGIIEDGFVYGTTEEGVKFMAKLIEGTTNEVELVQRDIDESTTLNSISNDTQGAVTFPSSFTYLDQEYVIKKIGQGACYKTEGITSVVIPEGVTEIAKNAFWDCTSLKQVSLPSTLISIGNNAFANCDLSSVDLPQNLTTIGVAVFLGNEKLTSIVLPRALTTIGSNVFTGTDLLSVNSPITDPFELENQGTFWPDFTKENPVILTVPYGTRQLYLDRGWTQREGNQSGAFYKVVEEVVEMNHVFTQLGEGARLKLHWEVNGISKSIEMEPGKSYQAYLRSASCSNFRIYITSIESDYQVKIMRNGETVRTYSGLGYFSPTAEMLDDNATWLISVEKSQAQYDVNGDGKVTIADVTKLVDVILGKE